MTGPEPAAAPQSAYGEVYDRGYAHYEGARLGRRQAFRALVRYSASRSLGIRKRWTAKVVPFILYAAALGITVVVIGIESFLSRVTGETVMSYGEFFAFIFVLEGMFVATIAPEMLCPDRREHVLTLYFSKAITRLDYVLAKLTAAALLTLTISFVPAAVLWLFRNLLAGSPLSALAHHLDDLARIGLIGLLIALYLGAIGMAIASFTGRRAIAVVVIIVGYVVTEALVNSLAAALGENRLADWVTFLSPTVITANLAQTLFPMPDAQALPFHWWAYAAGMIVTIAVAVAITLWRYVPER
jgi:ABC-2 type transport system permease protein